jgi:flagellar FliL protein
MSDELEPGEAPVAPKSGKMKWIIIGVAALVVVGGGVGGALMFMGGDKDKKEATAEASHEGTAEGEGGEEHVAAPAVYVPLEPAFLVNYQTADSSGYLQIAMEVSTTNPVTAELIKQHNPVIRNNLLMLLGAAPVDELKTREGKDKLRDAAREEINKIIIKQGQKQGVDEVLFTSFVLQ